MTSAHEQPENDQQSDDGLQLAQVIALFNDLLAETKVLETALYDCAEPLNLKSTLRTLAEAETTLRSAKSDLEQVDQIVKQRLSISGSFGSDRSAGSPDGKHDIVTGEFLSPKQIVTLFKIGQERPDYPQILLADHLLTVTGDRPAAMVKAQHQAQKERQLNWEALEETAKILLEDVESRTCPTCSAVPSQFCRIDEAAIQYRRNRNAR